MQIENVRASYIGRSRSNESFGSIGYVLKVRSSAETNAKRAANHRGLHCFRRIRSQAKVAANSVDRQRPQPDAVYSMVEMIDAGIAFIAAFEYAVVRRWPGLVAFGHGVFVFC